ncbi:uncharacterized protein LOC103935093 [Pyrus x bretschneideri]|uniref:uncharacterized protein LOC103935093 n=1 Tax=Pyrus x bretschneideri TaxID=225117 RepID=UPI00202F31E7|nr:uncharacterized protein LOC103935093 [Pyrus x bretschneideri]XP_048421700.1 uncharacterized protein LOC103935093 [Pyrus x bretschneideri]
MANIRCFPPLEPVCFGENLVAGKTQTRFRPPVPNYGKNPTLLEKTCDLLRNFPEYFDVVVSVARKIDGRHWADLPSAAGRSTDYFFFVSLVLFFLLPSDLKQHCFTFAVYKRLFEECFQRRWYRTAACYILVIAKVEGAAVSQYCALRLLQATLDESLYELAGELLRFLLRSGREYEQPSTDSDRLSPKILGYFGFRTNFRKQSLDKSTSFKEQNARVASAKNIVESHANLLMSGKELSKLVAFVKGAQFDLVEYLQRERNGSAWLENFASGLELIGQKASESENPFIQVFFLLFIFVKKLSHIVTSYRSYCVLPY